MTIRELFLFLVFLIIWIRQSFPGVKTLLFFETCVTEVTAESLKTNMKDYDDSMTLSSTGHKFYAILLENNFYHL